MRLAGQASLKGKLIFTFTIIMLTLITSRITKAEIFVSKFGSTGSGAGELGAPEGVVVDSAGNIYVADSGNQRVQKFDANGNFISQITGINAEKLALDADNNLYVSDPVDRSVRKYSPAGSFLLLINPTCLPGLGDCIDVDGPGGRPTVYRPDGVAVDAQNNVYVVGVFHLQKFSSSGSLITEFELGGIVGKSIVIDDAGNIIFHEKDNGTINKYDASANLIVQFADSNCNMATGFNCDDPDGSGPLERGDGQFGIGGPEDLAVDPWGNIYGTDPRNGRVLKFSAAGQFLLKFGSHGSGDGQFGEDSSGITVDASGNIYITDSNNRVQIFAQGDSRSVNSATGAGVVTLTTNFGMFVSAAAVAEESLPEAGKPANVDFPYGFFSWTVMGLLPGQSITMTMTHPAAIASGAQYWRVPDSIWTDATSSLTSDNGDNVLVVTVTDGGPGDADGVVNGRISHLGGLAAVVEAPGEVPFSAFQADVKIRRGPRPNDDDFEVRATLTLGAASDGINPVSEKVVLELGGITITIPAGSFTSDQRGRFRFDGTINSIDIRARINPLGGNTYDVRIDGDGANLTGITNPVTVKLVIGNDAGEASVVTILTKATPQIFL